MVFAHFVMLAHSFVDMNDTDEEHIEIMDNTCVGTIWQKLQFVSDISEGFCVVL